MGLNASGYLSVVQSGLAGGIQTAYYILHTLVFGWTVDIIDRLDVTVMTWLFLLRLLVCSFFSFGDELPSHSSSWLFMLMIETHCYRVLLMYAVSSYRDTSAR